AGRRPARPPRRPDRERPRPVPRGGRRLPRSAGARPEGPRQGGGARRARRVAPQAQGVRRGPERPRRRPAGARGRGPGSGAARADGRPGRLVGLIEKDLGQYRAAVAAYREALARDLKDLVKEEVRVELAESLLKLKEYAEALNVLDAARPPPAGAAQVLALRGRTAGPAASSA